MHRVESYLESKYLGLATVASGCLATFGVSDTNGLIAVAVSMGLIGAYWFIYRDQ
jgi:hypothetical protein